MTYKTIGNYNSEMAKAIRSLFEEPIHVSEQIHFAKKIPSEIHSLAKEKSWESEEVLEKLKEFKKQVWKK